VTRGQVSAFLYIKKGECRKAAWLLESDGQLLSVFGQNQGENDQKKLVFLVVLGQAIVRTRPNN
jgi:hypothetical protein